MKKVFIGALLYVVSIFITSAQEVKSADKPIWNFSAETNFYFFADDFIFLPVVKGDRDWLHIEARYNYENMETFSAWVGYNFSGGENWEYSLTPMMAAVVGLSNGLAPGIEFELTHKKWELYSESEYLFDFNNQNGNFFYSWADLAYSPKDWYWVGLSVQRTKLFQTNLEVERGILAGMSLGKFEMTAYLYNAFFDDPFVLVSLSANF